MSYGKILNIDTIKFKKNISDKNFNILATLNYYTLLTRNTFKFSSEKKDANDIFKAFFKSFESNRHMNVWSENAKKKK